VPESPRYLIAKGKHEKALQTLAKAHAQGNEEDEVVQIEYREIQETIKLEQEFEGNGWTELWRTPGNRHRLVILISLGFFSQWSGNGLVSYYMTDVLNAAQITNTQTQLAINGILNIINAIVAFVMCFFVDKLGRRPLFLVATGGMCLSFIVWTITARYAADQVASAANAEVAFIFIFYVFYNLAWSGLLVGYGVEILPYNIRAKVRFPFPIRPFLVTGSGPYHDGRSRELTCLQGLTIMFLAIDLALFFNSYVNPIALLAIGWKYYIVYVCWLAFEFAIVWRFYIETRNTPLEEIVRHFDGEGAILGGDLANEKSRQLERELGIYNERGNEPGLHGENKVVPVAQHVEELPAEK
jgi:MFS family permease